MQEILITGGSGLIGSKLIKKLKQKNYIIVLLSTQKSKQSGSDTLYWKPENNVFPALDLSRFSACINFCGAGIFDEKFTEKRKSLLVSSRINPIHFLLQQFKNQNVRLPHFISVSASGYYQNICLNELKEDSTQGEGFISTLVAEWEESSQLFKSCSERVSILRIGIVLSNKGGFLKKLTQPMRFFAGAVPGDGKQMISWIHIDDLAAMFIYLLEEKISGTFNAAAPQPENLDTITHLTGRLMHRPVWLPHIPVFALRLLFGRERSVLLLSSQRLSSEKIRDSGFTFQFNTIENALTDLLR